MHPNPRRILPILLIIAISAAAIWFFSTERSNAVNGKLSASGSIEATQVTISPELAGKVTQVLVRAGDTVQAGDALVQLDDTLLQAQLAQAEATLGQAKANYDLVAAGPTPEQLQSAISAARLELVSAQQALDALYETQALVAAQTLFEIATADKARDRATQTLDNMNADADQADVDAAWAAVVLAKDRLDEARKDFRPYEKKSEDDVDRALFQSRVAEAQKQYDALVTRYNNLVGTSNQYELALAEANTELFNAQVEDARRRFEEVIAAPDPDAVQLAEARLEAAKARLALAEAEPSPEQLALAQTQIDAAQAAVNTIQTQIEKLTLQAPMEGIVLTRSVEPGEFVAPAAPLLALARLDDLTITVFVPEDRYGAIRLGQEAQVEVDSFPGETFLATVMRIASEAEFTPRNVQTEEGRRTTVFAVELAVKNPEGKLKPGMPADVTFNE
jgi:multidrug resistance efflux pump